MINHWDAMAEFTNFKLQVGEPSPHMQIVGYLSQNLSLEEIVWRTGCYAVPYSVLTAEVLWTYWPLERVLSNEIELRTWLQENWEGIHIRTERRCVRTVVKFHECLTQYAHWVAEKLPEILKEIENLENDKAYDILWESATSVKYMGRYIVIRLLELLRRYAGLTPELYDIRSIGGWSPKKALALLYPEQRDELLQSNKQGDLIADKLAREALIRFQKEYELPIGFYIFAAMLCEYRVAFEEGKQYPARTHDQEIEYFTKKGSYWTNRGFQTRMFEARASLFPHEALGEFGGWQGIRPELNTFLRDREKNWSDLIYDYKGTYNFSDPVKREESLVGIG